MTQVGLQQSFDEDTMNLMGLPRGATRSDVRKLTLWPSLGFSTLCAERMFSGTTPLPRCALDVGSGLGNGLIWFAKRGAHGTGLEISSDLGAESRHRIASAGLQTLIDVKRVDVRQGLPVDPSAFDLVIFSNVGRLNMDVAEAVLQEFARRNAGTHVLWAESTYAPDVRQAAEVLLEAPSHFRLAREVVATEPVASPVPIITQMLLLSPAT